jgi:hypothetical protein
MPCAHRLMSPSSLWRKSVLLASAPPNFINPTMPTTPPPLQFSHQKGFEIETEHKNAIHELHGFGEKSNAQLMDRYKLGRSTIHRILDYETTTRAVQRELEDPLS